MTYCVIALAERPFLLYREETEKAADAAMHKLLCPAVVVQVHQGEPQVVLAKWISKEAVAKDESLLNTLKNICCE